MEGYTQEQIADIMERIEKFNKEIARLCEELKVEVVAIPKLVPTNDGSFVTRVDIKVGDTKHKPVLSPIQDVIKEK